MTLYPANSYFPFNEYHNNTKPGVVIDRIVFIFMFYTEGDDDK